MKTSEKGIDLLKVLEEGKGFSSKSYICSAGKRTIGYGHVILLDDNIIEPITEDQAEDILEKDVSAAENAINKYVKVPLTQNQFDALVCFVFNVGRTNFKTSTLLKSL
jgi:lysozyme